MATSTNDIKDGFQSDQPFVLIIEQPKKHVLFQCETAPILEEEIIQGMGHTSGVWSSYPSIKAIK